MKRFAGLTFLLLLLAACTAGETPPTTSPRPTDTATATVTTTTRPSPAPTDLPPTSSPAPPTETALPTLPPSSMLNVEPITHLEEKARTVHCVHRAAYLGVEDELVILDTSDLTQIAPIGRVILPGRVNDVHVDGHHAYVAVEGAGLWILDVRDPSRIEPVGSCPTPALAHSVMVVGHRQGSDSDQYDTSPGQVYAYVASSSEGLHVVDVSDPANPTWAGVYQELNGPLALAVPDGYTYEPGLLYVADWLGGLQILDVSDPAHPLPVAAQDTGWAIDVVVEGGYAYVAAGRAGLEIVDVSDPHNPFSVSAGFDLYGAAPNYPISGVSGVELVQGDWGSGPQTYLYLSMGEAGVQMWDVTDPLYPLPAGYFNPFGTAAEIGARGDVVYVTQEEAGVDVVRFTPRLSITQYGPFVQERPIHEWRRRQPTVRLPPWLELGEQEAGMVAEVLQAYEPLMHPISEWEVRLDHRNALTAAAEHFLETYPNGDGAIPVLIMLGHAYNAHGNEILFNPEFQPGKEYERAIRLLLERHPERIFSVLDDLIDLGMPIRQIELIDQASESGGVLAFGVTPVSGGSPRNYVYTIVERAGQGLDWVLVPLPTYDVCADTSIEAVADINGDGQEEIVVALRNYYGSWAGLRLHVFAWEEGEWVDRLDWRPLVPLHRSDSEVNNAEYWIEDLDQNGVQEIVLLHYTGPIGGGAPITIDLYQWDPPSQTYTNTRPIAVQVCSYHAFAEGERLRILQDVEQARPWYEQARRLFLSELESSDTVCAMPLYEWERERFLETIDLYLQQWQIQTVDSTEGTGMYTSLVLDASGYPHISYWGYGYSWELNGWSKLMYAHYDGTAWMTETVDIRSGTRFYTSLALDSSGRPHIAFYEDAPDPGLKYAFYTGSEWQIGTVDEGQVGGHPSLVLDIEDHPHIAYHAAESWGGDLRYAYFDGDAWRIETVDSQGATGGSRSLAIDALGQSHICYVRGDNLMYAYYDGATWHLKAVANEAVSSVSLVLDTADRPHLGYLGRNSDGDSLEYAYFDGNAWHLETVGSFETNAIGCPSLALDSTGRPHLSYFDSKKKDLKYTYFDGTAWQVETVDSEGDVGLDNFLVLDEAGRPHISYYDGTGEGTLKYAYRSNPVLLPETGGRAPRVKRGESWLLAN